MAANQWISNGELWGTMFLILVCATTGSDSDTYCNSEDSSSLLEFKAGFLDEEGVFSSWIASNNCCLWTGVNCTSAGRVQGLTVSGNMFKRTTSSNPKYRLVVGDSIGNLTALENLRLIGVHFIAEVPTTWGHLTNLKTLSLIECEFTGIPGEFGLLEGLVTWNMRQRSFPAPSAYQLPNEVCNLTKLKDVNLVKMGLTGLPSCLHRWTRIVSLSVPDNFLTGPIPSFLGNFSVLQSLEFGDNQFTDSIPISLMNLSALELLSFSYNRLTGNIPTEIGDMENLSFLVLDNNNLTSGIPKSLGRLSKLRSLALQFNWLSGFIPPDLGNLTKCRVIQMDHNFLSGPIPFELGKIPNLNIFIGFNKLSSSIPDSLGNLSTLDAQYNSLTGEIPLSLLSIPSLVSLDNNNLSGFPQVRSLPTTPNSYILSVSSNLLEGALPEWLSNCTCLRYLDLSDNKLEGLIPGSLIGLPKLLVLNLSYNLFTSKLPSGSFMSTLEYLYLQNNYLYGSISESFISCFRNLSTFFLGNNNLSGSIPSSFGDLMEGLTSLDISRNNLSGVIPDSLSGLAHVALSHNSLSGSIPSFGNLSGTRYPEYQPPLCLDLSYNFLTGSLPESLIQGGYRMARLQVGSNYLVGEIPDMFGSCDMLQSLSLHNNKFHGKLPVSLQNCSLLAVLDIGWNALSGRLPLWLSDLAPALRVFMIGSNNFDGVLPPWLSNFTSLQVLDFSNNKFSGRIPLCLNQLRGLLQEGQSLSVGTLYEEEIQISVKGQTLDYVYILSTTTSLDLSGNEIHGEIPPQMGDLEGLRFLNLTRNTLSGVIPTTFARLIALESLDLSFNKLNGPIPSQMAVEMTSLGFLNVSSNLLSGKIPFTNQFSTFLPSSFAANPGLCGPPLLTPCSKSKKQHEPPSSAPSLWPETVIDNWLSAPAFGVGVVISFMLVSSFLLPCACDSGKRMRAERNEVIRRQSLVVFNPMSYTGVKHAPRFLRKTALMSSESSLIWAATLEGRHRPGIVAQALRFLKDHSDSA